MRSCGLERQVAEFVDDQQFGLGEEGEPILQPAFRVRLGEHGDEGRGGSEQDRVALADRLVAERHGKNARPGRHILLIGHLDTVFEPDSPFQRFDRVDANIVRGPGT